MDSISAEISTWLVWENGWCRRRFTVSVWEFISGICKENSRADGWVVGFRFRFVLSPQPTPAALYLVKRCTWATPEEKEKLEHVEISPKSIDLTQEIAKRIGSDGGGALIIDYGKDGIISDSLQVCVLKKMLWSNAYEVFCVWIYGYNIRLLENTSLSTYWMIRGLRI